MNMLMMGPGMLMMFLALLINGGSRDLLDCLSTQAYWQTKNVVVNVDNMTLELGIAKQEKVGDITGLIKDMGSDDYATREDATKEIRLMGPGVIPQLKDHGLTSTDSEVVERSRQIIDSFVAGGKTKDIRRLMAIRALGELKKPEATASLKQLLDSKEPFVAEYARAAIAAIDGKPTFHRPTVTAKDLQADLNMLPAGLGAVAQMKLDGQDVGLIDTLAAQALPQAAALPPGFSPINIAKIKDMANTQVINVAEKFGNMRLDSVTVGVSKDVGPQGGFIVLIARGIFDPAVVGGEIAKELPPTKIKDVQFYANENAAVVLPSDHCLILVGGPNQNVLPLEEIATATKQAKVKFDQDPELVKLVAGIDTTKPVWAAIKVNDNYRQGGSPLTPYDSVEAVADRKDGALNFSFSGKGTDAKAVKAGVDTINQGIAGTVQQAQQMQAQQMQGTMPNVKDVLAFLNTLKCEANGVNGSFSGSLKTSVLTGSILEMLGMFEDVQQMAPMQQGQPMPVQPVPAPNPG